jgi:hypothetical protein
MRHGLKNTVVSFAGKMRFCPMKQNVGLALAQVMIV